MIGKESLKIAGNRFLDYLRILVFPYKCPVCGNFFQAEPADVFQVNAGKRFEPETFSFEKALERFLCPDCRADYTPVDSPMCPICGYMFKSGEGDDHVCGRCEEKRPQYGIARSYAAYDRSVRKSVHLLKFRNRMNLAGPLGDCVLAVFLRYWDPKDIDLLIPVPLHIKRMRKRGFNQAYLIIHKWRKRAEMFGADISHIRIEKHVLFKVRQSKPQVGMTSGERIRNVKRTFEVKNSSKIKGKRLLLVDDVFTTGATANECVRVLLKSGAGRVDVLTFGRTMLMS